jgi:streptomycin 3"-adenylyltransferase
MSQYGWADCPAPVRAQVEGLVAGLRTALGKNLIGVYLHGSLAMGCFNPTRSDLDLLVVTRRGMPVEMKREVTGLLLQVSGAPAPVEISFLRAADLRPWRHPTPYDFHYSEDWRERTRQALADGSWRAWNDAPPADPDLAAHIAITRRRGLRLRGAPIDQVFPVVPAADYLDSIVRDFHWGRAGLGANPVYFILNTCRIMAYRRAGLICSKDEGGAWALPLLPEEHRAVVARALVAYRGDDPPPALDPAVERFAAYMAPLVAAG